MKVDYCPSYTITIGFTKENPPFGNIPFCGVQKIPIKSILAESIPNINLDDFPDTKA